MVIGRLCDELKMHHVARMSKGGCGLEEGAVFTDLLNSFQSYRIPLCNAMVALLKGDENGHRYPYP